MFTQKHKTWLTICCLLAASTWARAQCITLDQLLDLSAIGTDSLTQRVARALPATDWTYRGPGRIGKEVYWTYKDPLDDYVAPDGSSEAWLSVRPASNAHIVTLKTVFPACVSSIRAGLRELKAEQKPVTCPDCEATRFESAQFVIDVYDRKKGPYPFIIVVRQAPAKATPPKGITTSDVPASSVDPNSMP